MYRNIPRILLIEPDGVLAEVTAFRLELLGYQVEVVGSAEAALSRLAEFLPELIIVDLTLDNTPATGLIERLASQEATSGIPVMVLSMDADLDHVTAVHKAGASDFLVVPYQPEVLQEKVVRLLSRRSFAVAKDKAKVGAS